jgi:hypothetical protein
MATVSPRNVENIFYTFTPQTAWEDFVAFQDIQSLLLSLLLLLLLLL